MTFWVLAFYLFLSHAQFSGSCLGKSLEPHIRRYIWELLSVWSKSSVEERTPSLKKFILRAIWDLINEDPEKYVGKVVQDCFNLNLRYNDFYHVTIVDSVLSKVRRKGLEEKVFYTSSKLDLFGDTKNFKKLKEMLGDSIHLEQIIQLCGGDDVFSHEDLYRQLGKFSESIYQMVKRKNRKKSYPDDNYTVEDINAAIEYLQHHTIFLELWSELLKQLPETTDIHPPSHSFNIYGKTLRVSCTLYEGNLEEEIKKHRKRVLLLLSERSV